MTSGGHPFIKLFVRFEVIMLNIVIYKLSHIFYGKGKNGLIAVEPMTWPQ